MTGKSLITISSTVLLAYQICVLSVQAQQANTEHLDLSSTDRNITAGSEHSGTITVGGSSVTVTPGSLLTAAESVALSQVLGGGTQSLVLDASGAATGGQFTVSGNNFSTLVIPNGVTAVRNFGDSGSLSVTGNLSNAGNFYAVSNNSSVMNAVISAQNINNLQGGLITSILPQGGLNGFSNLLGNLNLTLNAVQNIVNYGSISSAGNLNMTAGGSIINALPAGLSGPNPLIQAMGNVDLVAAAIQNAGMITSLNANLNVASQLAQNLTINNTSGVMQAINGKITVRDQLFSGKFNTELLGGDWISKELNVWSGDGHINVDVNEISSQVNLIGGTAALASHAGDLHVGALTMTGDPTISSAGDVLLEMSQFGGEWIFPGLDALVINAGGNIINRDVSLIGTTAASGATGSVIMTAGGFIDLQTVPILSISTSTNGAQSGSIILSAGSDILLSGTLSTASTGAQAGDVSISSTNGSIISSGNFAIDTRAQGANSGNVNLSANTGIIASNGISILSSSDSGNAGSISLVTQLGDINLGGGSAQTTINATSNSGLGAQFVLQSLTGGIQLGDGSILLGSANNSAGALNIFANGGSVSFGKSVIDASGFNGGSVSIMTTWGNADVNLSQVAITANGLSGGQSGSVNISTGLFGPGSSTSDKASIGSIQVNGANSASSSIYISTGSGSDIEVQSISSNGANITLMSAGNLQVDSIVNDNAAGTGGSINLISNANAFAQDPTNTLNINSGGGANSVSFLSANGASGGSILAANYGTGGINAGSIVINAAGGNGGNITLSADGDLNLTGTNYSTNGGSGGYGGQVSFSSGNTFRAGSASVSATGGTDYAGGTLSINAGSIDLGNLSSDTSGHGTGSSGIVAIGGSNAIITGNTVNLVNNGGGAGSVQLSGDLATSTLNITAQGGDFAGKNGGNISLLLTNGLNGVVNLDASGAANGSGGDISISSQGNLNLQAGQVNLLSRGGSTSGSGGFLFLSSNGSMTIDASTIDLSQQSGNGNGGSLTIDTGLDSTLASGALLVNGSLNLDGAGNGNGGSVIITTRNTNSQVSNLTVGAGSGFEISAASGLSSGNGGTITLNVGGDLNLDASALSVATRGINGSGGTINLTAGSDGSGGLLNQSHTLSVSGSLRADGTGSGNGGQMNLLASQINLASGSTLSASANGSGAGGTISVNASGTDCDLNLFQNNLLASSDSGAGGSILLNASRNISVNESILDSSSAASAGGQISIAAGNLQTGSISLAGDLLANGSSSGGDITLSQNSSQAMQIGTGATDAILSATGSNGQGGNLNLVNAAGNLIVTVEQNIDLSGKSLATLGRVNASSTGNVDISGSGSLSGSFTGSAVSYNVTIDGAASNLGAGSISTTSGELSLIASAANSSLIFAPGANISTQTGAIELGAASMHFAGDALISMDNAGVLKVNSGSQSNSLSMDFADSSTVTFNVTQAGAVRPGTVQIGPNGNGALTMSTSGSATVDFTGATVSMTSSGLDLSLSSGLSLNSDAYDSSQNLGMEIIASGANVNLSSAVSARQLNVSTIGSGNINLASEINAPTVVMSVEGNSSINQTGAGTIGIGTLVLSSGSGNIGSASNPIESNVLELQVTSGASAYINNASTVDLKTSTVVGTLSLNNDGDVSIESAVNAANLDINASGSISIFNQTGGSSGVSLAASGQGTNIHITSGVQLASQNGFVNLSTASLVLDGSISAKNSVSVDSASGNLNLSGAGGQIALSGTNGLISISSQDSVNFDSSYTLNAGTTGTAQIQTASLSTSGVSLANNVQLSAAGGSQLNIFSNQLNFANGASIASSNSSNALTVQSTAGAPLTVNVAGGSTANINSANGGSVQFTAGVGQDLSFQSQGLGTSNLSVNGAQLVTTSTGANTNLNNLNLASSENIEINVNGGTLNLDGDISSSKSNGVIVLQDPLGISIAGNGTVGFSSGLSGTINVLAMNLTDSINIIGTPNFNAGQGTVNFISLGSINFGQNSKTTVNDGATVNVSAPLVSFADGAHLYASGASSINFSGTGSEGINIAISNGASQVSTQGGAINISAQDSAPVTFSQLAGGSSSTLNLMGAPVTISSLNADVTVDENVVIHSDNNVSVLTPGGTLINNGLIDNQDPGGSNTTIIQATGNLFINENVSANSLIIRTSENGNITLSADVNVVNDLTVSADGSGWIKQTAGILRAASISLNSGTGKIGSKNQSIKVDTQQLEVSTQGAAFVQAAGPVRLSSYTAGGGLNLQAGGNITIGAQGASEVSINSNGTFNAGSGGTVLIEASNLIDIGSNLKLKVKESDFSLSAQNIQLGNNVVLKADGDLSLAGAVSGEDFKLVSREGNLQISGSLSGHNLKLQTGKNGGDIILDGNMEANKLSAIAKGEGDIVQLSGLISAKKLELKSGSGNIGTAAQAINLRADDLSVNTWGQGSVNISAQGDLTVDKSSSGRDFNLNASGSLKAGDIETRRGSITLASTGSLEVEKNAKITANQGNLTLQNKDAKNGTITIGKNASLIALSNSQSNGLGNVAIVVGEMPARPVAGTAPKGLDVSQKWGGHAYFGKNGITVKGKNNEVNAWGSNVVFSTGTRSKSAIVLEGGVYILADPPPESGAQSSQIAAASISPASNSISSSQAPAFTLAALSNAVSNINTNTGHSNLYQPSLSHLDNLNKKLDSQFCAKEESGLKTVAHVTALTGSVVKEARIANESFEKSSSESNRIYSNGSYEKTADAIIFKKGEMLIDSRNFTKVKSAQAAFEISGNSCALIKSDGESTEIFNVYESRWGGVKVKVNEHEFVLGAGQRLLIGKNSQVAVRNETVEKIMEKEVKIAEFPLLSLVANSDLMAKLMKGQAQDEKQLASRLFKMAACLHLVTVSHGSFKN